MNSNPNEHWLPGVVIVLLDQFFFVPHVCPQSCHAQNNHRPFSGQIPNLHERVRSADIERAREKRRYGRQRRIRLSGFDTVNALNMALYHRHAHSGGIMAAHRRRQR
ncbi:hypothetical protein HanPSC8_Chr01g0000751 [Helianthus annuus]|nr:hypothetical protein HanIR_Chr01g0001071 [Helianthus annuus]KAJ0955251.1 hypothetical protein HanPSC8_Chr01g0000751 [Helianthus annuus]